MHAHGAKAHNLYPGDNAGKDNIAAALKRGALAPQAWELVRANMRRAAAARPAAPW